jgi:hypothetical protein
VGKTAGAKLALAVLDSELGIFPGAAITDFFVMSFSVNIHFSNPFS